MLLAKYKDPISSTAQTAGFSAAVTRPFGQALRMDPQPFAANVGSELKNTAQSSHLRLILSQ